MPEAYAAIDLGATSGRVVTGRLDGERITLEEVHRFHNRPVRLPDGLRWNLLHLFTEALEGLRRAGPLAGVGVDTWAVDYALLDGDGRVLGLPFHYRDERTSGMEERAFGRVPQAELYAATGIQTLPINTVFQLLADEGSAALAAAERLALVPDLLAYWLCGELANESTNASTTGLLDARSGEWAGELIERLGLPRGIFGALIEPGTALGPLLDHHDLGPVTTYAVASHDTASAFAAAPVRDEHAAILSSGTWSLLGLDLPEPVLKLTPRARPTSPTSAASTAPRGGPTTSWACGCSRSAGARGTGSSPTRSWNGWPGPSRAKLRPAVRPRRPQLPRAGRHARADRGRVRGRPRRPTSPPPPAASWSRSPASTAG